MTRDQNNVRNIPDWLPKSDGIPVIMAGPCSAETEQQIMKTAEGLAVIPEVKVFRAGIWKPRTRAGEFEGIGEKGLGWIKKAGDQFGFISAVEVGTREHAERSIDAGIDWLWIGARTVSNPFSVKEIAAALKNKQKPVLIKNPPFPDDQLWQGAFERFYSSGIKKLTGIFRGFHNHGLSRYRNIPLWNRIDPVVKSFTGLPVFCDPSHIAGKNSLVGHIAEIAVYLNFDGLMIETHYNPQKALTDPRQQLTPGQLKELITRIRSKIIPGKEQVLQLLREEVDYLDSKLLETLQQRFKFTGQIGNLKAKLGQEPFQSKRWNSMLEARINRAGELNINEKLITEIFELIHRESLKRQGDQDQI